MKFWMIVEASEEYCYSYGSGYFYAIPKRFGPTRIYYDRRRAEAELFRLKNKIPNGRLILLEAVGICLPDEERPNLLRIEDMEMDNHYY